MAGEAFTTTAGMEVYTMNVSELCNVYNTAYYLFLDRKEHSVGSVMERIKEGTYHFPCSTIPLTLIFSERMNKYYFVSVVKEYLVNICRVIMHFKEKIIILGDSRSTSHDMDGVLHSMFDKIDNIMSVTPFLVTLCEYRHASAAVKMMQNWGDIFAAQYDGVRVVHTGNPAYVTIGSGGEVIQSGITHPEPGENEHMFVEKHKKYYAYMFVDKSLIHNLLLLN